MLGAIDNRIGCGKRGESNGPTMRKPSPRASGAVRPADLQAHVTKEVVETPGDPAGLRRAVAPHGLTMASREPRPLVKGSSAETE